MKRALVVLVLALVVGGAVASLMMREPGYVLLVYAPWSIETSLWFFLLVLVAAYVAVRVTISLFLRIARSRSGIRSWTESRRLRHAHEQTLRGLLLLAEGEPAAARDALLAAAPHAELPLVNYLASAHATAALGDWPACRTLLERAESAAPGAVLGVRLAGVALFERHGRIGECRQQLEALRAEAQRHPRVLRSLAECYRALRDWQALIDVLGDLERNKSIPDDAVQSLAHDAWTGRMAELDADALIALWASIPKKSQVRPRLALAFSDAAQRVALADAAEEALRRALAESWDADLVDAYGALAGGDARRRRAHLDTWLQARPDDAGLWLASGRVAAASHDFARAREHFETSLKRAPTAAVYGELGRLCLALGERERGAEYLLRYAELGGAALPALPLPGQRGA
jgi:HemY protein